MQKMAAQNSESSPLRFHSIHGENLVLSNDDRQVNRKDSFGKAITFSNRPISVNESICLRFVERAEGWHGGLRLGITNIDPVTLIGNLPMYAHPGLTKMGKTWVSCLRSDCNCAIGNLLHFFVVSSGEMIVQVSGAERYIHLDQIDTTMPMYVVFDIYGQTKGIEIIDDIGQGRSAPYSPRRAPAKSNLSGLVPAQSNPQARVPSESNLPRRVATDSALPNVDASRQKIPVISSMPQPKGIGSPSTIVASVKRGPEATTSTANENQAPIRVAKPENLGECAICMVNPSNASVYPCGHVMMCFECGVKTWRSQKICPMCRVEIKDIVRIYVAG